MSKEKMTLDEAKEEMLKRSLDFFSVHQKENCNNSQCAYDFYKETKKQMREIVAMSGLKERDAIAYMDSFTDQLSEILMT